MLSIFTSAAVFSPHHGQKVRRLLTSETLDFRRFAGSICQHILFFFFLLLCSSVQAPRPALTFPTYPKLGYESLS